MSEHIGNLSPAQVTERAAAFKQHHGFVRGDQADEFMEHANTWTLELGKETQRDLQATRDALESGDTTRARQAFNELRTDTVALKEAFQIQKTAMARSVTYRKLVERSSGEARPKYRAPPSMTRIRQNTRWAQLRGEVPVFGKMSPEDLKTKRAQALLNNVYQTPPNSEQPRLGVGLEVGFDALSNLTEEILAEWERDVAATGSIEHGLHARTEAHVDGLLMGDVLDLYGSILDRVVNAPTPEQALNTRAETIGHFGPNELRARLDGVKARMNASTPEERRQIISDLYRLEHETREEMNRDRASLDMSEKTYREKFSWIARFLAFFFFINNDAKRFKNRHVKPAKVEAERGEKVLREAQRLREGLEERQRSERRRRERN